MSSRTASDGSMRDRRVRTLARLTTPRRSSWWWGVLWTLVIVAELLALLPLVQPSAPPVEPVAVVYRLIGGSFAACGLIAWRRRPDSRSGLLMTIVGFGFFVHPLSTQLPGALAATVGFALVKAWIPVYAWLLLTLTTGGRLVSWIDRALVAAFALGMVLLNIAWMMVTELPGNLLLVAANPALSRQLDLIERWTVLLACIGTVGVVVFRFAAATPPLRRALAPSIGGAITLSFFAAQLVDGLVTAVPSEVLLWSSCLALLAVPVVFLLGLLRSGLARAGLAGLFVSLPSLGVPAVQDRLARSLDDPGLVMVRKLPGGGWVDVQGRPFELPPDHDRRRVLPIRSDGIEVAALIYDAGLDEDPELLAVAHAAASLAVENQLVQAESERRLRELRTSRNRLLKAADDERRRLERNLHDGAQQRLVAVRMQLGQLRNQLTDPDSEQQISAAMIELARSQDELRELAHGLHPAALGQGLSAALESLVGRSPVPTDLRCSLPAGQVPEAVSLAVYYVVAESLTNVAKHAAAGVAVVDLVSDGNQLALTVSDDGVGAAPEQLSAGSGVRGLAERVAALDGSLRVDGRPGLGTVVTVRIPLS